MHIRLKLKEEYFLVLFFLLGLFFYLNLDKLPLTHPGNVKAADPFYHTAGVESILDTKQWNYYSYYLSFGNEKVINHQPPLIYTAAAMLSEFTGLPAWDTLYFFVCISQAFFIILVYLITYEGFNNKKIALIAAGLSILPFPLKYWLYGLYIGLWLQVPGYFFIMAFLWLTIKYIKTRKDYLLVVLGLLVSAVVLVHLADMSIVFFEVAALGIVMLLDFLKEKNFMNLIKRGLMLGIFPLMSIITVLPRILYVWSGLGTNMFTPGIYSLDRNLFPKDQYGGMVWPHFDFFPGYIKVLFFIGMAFLLIVSVFFILSLFSKKFGMPYFKTDKGRILFSMKKDPVHVSYFFLFLVVLAYFATVYLSPLFFSNPYYLGGRARALQPFFVYPVVAFVIWIVLSSVLNFIAQEKSRLLLLETGGIILLILFVIAANYSEYMQLTEGLKYEHITEAKWNSFRWLQENTPNSAKVLFFDGIFQGENIYTKRMAAVMSIDDLNNFLKEYQATNKTPEIVHTAGWGGNTIREGAWKYEKSFFDYGDYSELNSTQRTDFFDYLVFENFAQEAVNVNMFLANEYVKKGYRPVYNDGFSIILENERK